jgi:hypothetical protein
MRRLLGIPFLFLFAGCPPSWGYHVNLTVTVPPEVQAKVSPSNPGLLMVQHRVVAQLCQPSGAPFSLPFSAWIAGKTCDKWHGGGYEEMFVVHLSDSDVAWFSANHPNLVFCGQSGPISDQKTIGAVMDRATAGGWGPQGTETIAAGVGGACDDAGNYAGTIVVSLLNP